MEKKLLEQYNAMVDYALAFPKYERVPIVQSFLKSFENAKQDYSLKLKEFMNPNLFGSVIDFAKIGSVIDFAKMDASASIKELELLESILMKDYS